MEIQGERDMVDDKREIWKVENGKRKEVGKTDSGLSFLFFSTVDLYKPSFNILLCDTKN